MQQLGEVDDSCPHVTGGGELGGTEVKIKVSKLWVWGFFFFFLPLVNARVKTLVCVLFY